MMFFGVDNIDILTAAPELRSSRRGNCCWIVSAVIILVAVIVVVVVVELVAVVDEVSFVKLDRSKNKCRILDSKWIRDRAHFFIDCNWMF